MRDLSASRLLSESDSVKKKRNEKSKYFITERFQVLWTLKGSKTNKT